MAASSIVVLGAGGHAGVLLAILQHMPYKILGLVDKDKNKWGCSILGYSVLGGEEELDGYDVSDIVLVNGLGGVGITDKRRVTYEKYLKQGFCFATVIHSQAIVADTVRIATGGQIMAGAVLQNNSVIGENCLINTGAVIDHDCLIDAHTHIASGAILSGGVKVGRGCHIGTGANIIQNIIIGNNCLIAAGATVVADVPPNCKVRGVPAKIY